VTEQDPIEIETAEKLKNNQSLRKLLLVVKWCQRYQYVVNLNHRETAVK